VALDLSHISLFDEQSEIRISRHHRRSWAIAAPGEIRTPDHLVRRQVLRNALQPI